MRFLHKISTSLKHFFGEVNGNGLDGTYDQSTPFQIFFMVIVVTHRNMQSHTHAGTYAGVCSHACTYAVALCASEVSSSKQVAPRK